MNLRRDARTRRARPLRAAATTILSFVAMPSIARAHGGFESAFDSAPYNRHWFLAVGLHGQLGTQGNHEIADVGLEISALRFLDIPGSRIGSVVGIGPLV